LVVGAQVPQRRSLNLGSEEAGEEVVQMHLMVEEVVAEAELRWKVEEVEVAEAAALQKKVVEVVWVENGYSTKHLLLVVVVENGHPSLEHYLLAVEVGQTPVQGAEGPAEK
jgi:hypothetical protein